MPLTLQDHIFSVAWFSMRMKCPLHSIQTILYPGPHFKSHFPGCLFLSTHNLQFEKQVGFLLESFELL